MAPCVQRRGKPTEFPRLNNSRVTHYISIREDITERIRLEQTREDIERMMRRDLKTPLNAIIGYPQLLLRSNLTERQRIFVQNFKDAGDTMLTIVNNYLDLSRIESGTYHVTPQTSDALELLDQVRIDLEASAAEKQVQPLMLVNQRLSADVESVTIKGERALCYSIFSNLITNAIEASPTLGTVLIEVTAVDDGVETRITNRGKVPEAIQDRFFEKYVSFSKEKGTGLGTYAARLTVEAQGGSISMQTSETDGTQVTVSLPGQVQQPESPVTIAI